jgi:hypothetical protein
MVDPTKIVAIVNVEAPTNVHMLQLTPGQTRYYRRFINGYTTITAPMEHSLKKQNRSPMFVTIEFLGQYLPHPRVLCRTQIPISNLLYEA